MACRKLRWICSKYSNDVVQQVKTPICLSHDMNFLSHRRLYDNMRVIQMDAAVHGFLLIVYTKVRFKNQCTKFRDRCYFSIMHQIFLAEISF